MILCNKNGKQFHNIECVEGKCLKCGTETLNKRMEPLITTNEGVQWQKWDNVRVINRKTGKEI